MLPRPQRIPNARTIKRLYAKGRRCVTATAFIYVAPSHARSFRAAVVCGKKVSNGAVIRNRLKRVARSVIEAHRQQLPAGQDFLITLRPTAAGHEEQLRHDLAQLFKPYVRPVTTSTPGLLAGLNR